ncbi:MAG: diguanylate cyclase [Halomonas sp.]|nr:diguanylate cyclase [Halomonas sp.]
MLTSLGLRILLATLAVIDMAPNEQLAASAAPVEIEGRCLQVSASLGVADYGSDDGGDEDLLLRHADQAMYRAKDAGKQCFRVQGVSEDGASTPVVDVASSID